MLEFYCVTAIWSEKNVQTVLKCNYYIMTHMTRNDRFFRWNEKSNLFRNGINMLRVWVRFVFLFEHYCQPDPHRLLGTGRQNKWKFKDSKPGTEKKPSSFVFENWKILEFWNSKIRRRVNSKYNIRKIPLGGTEVLDFYTTGFYKRRLRTFFRNSLWTLTSSLPMLEYHHIMLARVFLTITIQNILSEKS